ncbi:MAG: hypothetical protein BRC48_09765 [Cyanobacteria bacterium QS_9_48_30]|nr:MAG: hypothetical protein BRC48_09765 [Cyanobacteria bacterium QS_9_48_30]
MREQTDKPILGILLTHPHTDHYGGLPVFVEAAGGDIPIYAAQATAEDIRTDKQGFIEARNEKKTSLIRLLKTVRKLRSAVSHSRRVTYLKTRRLLQQPTTFLKRKRYLRVISSMSRQPRSWARATTRIGCSSYGCCWSAIQKQRQLSWSR